MKIKTGIVKPKFINFVTAEKEVPQIKWTADLIGYDENENEVRVACIFKQEDTKCWKDLKKDINQYIYDYNHFKMTPTAHTLIEKYNFQLIEGKLLDE